MFTPWDITFFLGGGGAEGSGDVIGNFKASTQEFEEKQGFSAMYKLNYLLLNKFN